MSDLTGVKVGEVLWHAPSSRHEKPGAITVTKVRRKYAFFGVNCQFTLATGAAGYGKVYRSKADWQEQVPRDWLGSCSSTAPSPINIHHHRA